MKRIKPVKMIQYLAVLAMGLCFSGCCTMKRGSGDVIENPDCCIMAPNPISGTEMDLTNMEKVIMSPRIKAYPVGRFIDPNDPTLMHESHTVYRQEAPASWNRSPNAPTAVPLGPTIAVSHPERQETALSVEYETKIMQQNQLMKSIIDQNEVLIDLTNQLKAEIETLKTRNST